MDNEDITIYGLGGGYLGMSRRPEERPLTLRAMVNESPAAGPPAAAPVMTRQLPARLAHLRDEPGPAWTHGVPPLRLARNRGTRTPTRGGRRFDRIYLAEDGSYAGDIAVHFERDAGMGDIISLTVADFFCLQAAVTDPAKPVTARQVREFLTELLARRRAGALDGMGEDVRAFGRILRLLED